MVGGGRWALTASCEQEWQPVISASDFHENLACYIEVGVVGCFVAIR